MTIRVRYYVLFWIYANRKREEAVQLEEGATLAELIAALSERNGRSFAEHAVEGGAIHRYCWCLVNGRRVASPNLRTPLRDGDEVTFTTPLVVGG